LIGGSSTSARWPGSRSVLWCLGGASSRARWREGIILGIGGEERPTEPVNEFQLPARQFGKSVASLAKLLVPLDPPTDLRLVGRWDMHLPRASADAGGQELR
jgi:hypothetical protein